MQLPALIIAAGLAVATAACALQAQERSAAGGGCAPATSPGVTTQQIRSGGRERSYRLYVPPGHDGRTPLPLVLDLHGSGGSADGQAATSRFETLAAREGVLVATLQAAGQGNRWNVPATSDRSVDVQYVADVIDDVATRACLDVSRVYATGFSGGGRMSSLLACRLGDRIAAIAPMAGLRWPGSCRGRAVPVLAFHGLADNVNAYGGGGAASRGGEWVESVSEALAGWAGHNGCSGEPRHDDPPGPLSIVRYSGCRDGAEVRLVSIEGLDHRWARDEVDATAEMWRFFREHALDH